MPILDHFSLIAPYYEAFIGSSVPEKLISLLGLPVDGCLLDIGGGTGRVSQQLMNLVRQTIVLDSSKSMLDQAARKTGLTPVCSESERLPFQDCSFERVLMVDALHHVISQKITAREMWRVLKPGGMILIEEPDIHILSVKLMALVEKILLMRSHFLKPGQISRLFDDRQASIQITTQGTSAWVLVEKL